MSDSGRPVIEGTYFRHVLSHLPTGVTVVTAHGRSGPVGMVANSVTSVSLDPPLMLFCPAKTSTTWPAIHEAGRFCINVMSAGSTDLVQKLAGKTADRFENLTPKHRPAGPALEDAVAWIECEIEQEHDAGDHVIVVARVIAIEADTRASESLVFFRGRYGVFASAELG